MKMIVNFFKKWNGAVFFVPVVVIFFVANHLMSHYTGEEYPLLAVVGIILAVSKVFLAEAIASALLYFNQPKYFTVIHDDENLPRELWGDKYRSHALNTYYAYLLASALILAFA